MKKLFVSLLIILAAACQQQKIGYVDTVELLDGYQEKIDAEARFNTKRDAFTKKRDSISQAFQLELQDFQAKAQKMSQKNAQEQYGLLQQKGQFVGQQLQQEEQQLQQIGQTEIDSIVSKVKKEIKAYGKTNGYAFILSGGEGGAVLYGNEADDLTEEVLKILNEKYKK
ncbi:MAG: hypothetical protein CMH48_05595 [Muricauda sp.]|nr:OmpH family outer membrane protein [Allomuricauda sp.]MAU26269.1 hypothetical protein [Allomuricauda sp.]MBC30299.1 hypothetical protein [Allomuricauda sp.]|tara:strand:+ start:1378 stop:1884 length:507 start_codon:yes stop_codon:yes gene_type:complete